MDTVDTGHRAVARLQERHDDVLLCDLRMSELDGPTFDDILASQCPSLRLRVVFLTGDTLFADSLAFLEQCGQRCRRACACVAGMAVTTPSPRAIVAILSRGYTFSLMCPQRFWAVLRLSDTT